MPTNEMRSFNEWSLDGYKIKSGSKATWVDGKPVFRREDVTKINGKARRSRGGASPQEDRSDFKYTGSFP